MSNENFQNVKDKHEKNLVETDGDNTQKYETQLNKQAVGFCDIKSRSSLIKHIRKINCCEEII